MEFIKPTECTVLVIDSVSLKECSDKTPNDELIARGSVKIKTFRRSDSTSLLTRNPVKDSEEDFYYFYGKKITIQKYSPSNVYSERGGIQM